MSTQTKPFSEWADKELIENAKELHSLIYNEDCFGVNDLMWYEGICEELDKRGYELVEDSELKITKIEDEKEETHG